MAGLASKLLFRPKAHENECIVSYLVRVGELNGFKHIGHLLQHAGMNWKNSRAPVHQMLSGEYDVARLLDSLDLPTHRSKLAPLYRSFQRVIDTPYVLVKHPRICPECLADMGYCDYRWCILPLVACSRHKRILVDVSHESGNRLSWYRQHLDRFDGDDRRVIETEGKLPPSLVKMCGYFDALLSGEKESRRIPFVLLDLEFREALSLLHFLMHYQSRLTTGYFRPLALHNDELAQAYDEVWKILIDWPDSFYSLLSQYVENPMSQRGRSGVNKHFRDLYERLHRQRDNRGIARIKVEFDRYIQEYWPGALEQGRITRMRLVSDSRNVISKKEAAHILGSRIERIDKLVQQERITPVIFRGKSYYLRDQVEGLADEKSSNWTMAQACQALELTRYQLKQLLDAGVIPAKQRPGSLNRDWVVDRIASLSLIGELRKKARNTMPKHSLSLSGIQRQGYSIVTLVLAMQNGEINYGIDEAKENISSFKQFTAFEINVS